MAVSFTFTDIVFEDEVNYDGFFQCEKFFIHNRDFILEIFEPACDIKKYIIEKYEDILNLETCAIHVRRGDFLKFSHIHAVQNIEYFKKGIEAIGKVDKYVIFSDEIEWCKDNFYGENYV